MTRRGGLLRPRSLASVLAVLLLAWLAQQSGLDGHGLRDDRDLRTDPRAETASDDGIARIARAFAAHESGFLVTVEGEVARLLADDRDGSRHQRLLLRLDDATTVLVAHNIDLARRVPVRAGDRLRVRGQYEWNERGGVLHWTHRDPRGDHAPGWIEFAGRRFE